jgi:hypothetical protein
LAVVNEIRCPNCAAPISFNPGEIVATCKYCGFTSVIETGKAFTFEHSMILNRYDEAQAEELVRNWMRGGFMKPGDLARASRVVEKKLVYLPFWVVPVAVRSRYKGVFERLSPPVVKEGEIEKKYSWVVLARKAVKFPTREYDVSLDGKAVYDFRKIEGFAKVLNSEVEEAEAVEVARQQVESHQLFLAKQDVDKIIEIKNEVSVGDAVYLHTPIWFIVYEYKRERYNLILDGATGAVIKGDIPTTKFGLF